MADWLSENWTRNFLDTSPPIADTTNFDANREWLDIVFNGLTQITSIRLQGIRNLRIGGTEDATNNIDLSPLPKYGNEELHGTIRQFEVWCSDGNDWLVQDGVTN